MFLGQLGSRSLPPAYEVLMLLVSPLQLGLQGLHSRHVLINLTADVGNGLLVIGVLCIRMLCYVGKVELGMAVVEQVGCFRVAVSLVIGGLGRGQVRTGVMVCLMPGVPRSLG